MEVNLRRIMHINLQSYTALVSGSTQGIGRATAMALAASGARVILAARNADKLQETLLALPNPNSLQHQFIVADFAEPEQVQNAVAALLNTLDSPVHILVNNTGGPASGKVSDAQPDQFIAAFRQHLISNHLLATACIPGMREAAYGRIINVISTSVKAPLPNLGVSNTVRAAVANWAKTLATEVGQYGITVNNVLPGATSTERLQSIIAANAARTQADTSSVAHKMQEEIPLRRFAEPSEIANAIIFLASPQAAYINGINLPVDGGRTPSL